MDWLRTHYDRVAVIAGALFLLLCSFFIWRSAAAFEEHYTVAGPGPQRTAIELGKAAELEDAAQKLRNPPQWTFSGRSGLFVPEKHFIGPGGMPATLQTTEVHPPVPNEWLDQFGLPIAEADVLQQDPDNDGFTNLEEWHGRTNPIDPNSHPPYHTKLRLRSARQEPFALVFASESDGAFTLNYINPAAPAEADGRARIDRTRPSIVGKMNEPLQQYDAARRQQVPVGYTIVGFDEKTRTNPNTGGEEDVSELTLQRNGTDERITLVKERPIVSPQSVATFVYTWRERREIQVKKDEEFSLPPQEEIRYKLIDVRPDRAVIVNTQKPDERIEIGPASP
jgi:hypothetical protein